MEICFFDLEYTSWEGAKSRNWSGEAEHREVIEVGALRLNLGSRTVVSKMATYVRPTINRTLSDYIVGLTGIAQQSVDSAPDFPHALQLLLDFLAGTTVWVYGETDVEVLAENCALNNVDSGRLKQLRIRDIQPAFAQAGVDVETTSTGELAGIFGVAVRGRAHTALVDAQSLAAAALVLVDRGTV